MNILGALARLLTGSSFAVLGCDALRAPGKRPEVAGPGLDAIRRVVPLPQNDELLVRTNAAVQVGAGATLALGIFPRVSALTLAGSLVPTTYAGHPFWTVADPAQRKQQQVQFIKNAALLGGLLAVVSSRRK